MPLKVPEVEKFYKLPDSRTVVEFRINTGFTASCFFGTLLVAFAQINDSYISTRCSACLLYTSDIPCFCGAERLCALTLESHAFA